MAVNEQNLVWLDLEMTGLNPDDDRIIEIATIVTDGQLNILAEGPVFAIHQSDERLAAMDSWNTKHHNQSGLVQRVKASDVDEAQAAEQTIEFLQDYIKAGVSPMCGNTICQDRRFIYRWMPKLCEFFHYRNLDVSTVKELAKRWAPEIFKAYKKESKHEALSDIRDSIDEMKYYQQNFFKF